MPKNFWVWTSTLCIMLIIVLLLLSLFPHSGCQALCCCYIDARHSREFFLYTSVYFIVVLYFIQWPSRSRLKLCFTTCLSLSFSEGLMVIGLRWFCYYTFPFLCDSKGHVLALHFGIVSETSPHVWLHNTHLPCGLW